jgi:hypothetical protein
MSHSKWLVVGAGPNGIAHVGRLLDHGGIEIVWVDPCFKTGRMGKYYRNVPANTLTRTLLHYLRYVQSWNFDKDQIRRKHSPAKSEYYQTSALTLSDVPESDCPTLGLFVDALDDITNRLKLRVECYAGYVTDLHYRQADRRNNIGGQWSVTILQNDNSMVTVNVDAVIYCGGSVPKQLDDVNAHSVNYSACGASSSRSKHSASSSYYICSGVCIHQLDCMVDPSYCQRILQRMAHEYNDDHDDLQTDQCSSDTSKLRLKDMTWGVIGSNHSAILITKNLIEAGARMIKIFARSDYRYMEDLGDGMAK